MPDFQPVRIAAVVPETADACSLVLETTFDYRPGQYLTVRTPAGARCYSLSTAPGVDDRPAVTVKRVPGGQVSNWICDHVRAGDTVDMAGPAGSFTPDSFDDDLLFLAAGSGITPIMGILKALRGDPVLVYANRDAESIIFRDRLDAMLPVIHWLDSERGVPTAESLRELTTPYVGREAFICGPEAFVAVAEKALLAAGMAAASIRVERFEPEPVESRAAVAEVTIDGQTHVLPWAPGKRLLDVIIDAGLNPPYSCRQGQCGACAVRLVSGEVTLVNNEILDEEDFAEGYTLACQAVPLSDSVTVTYY
ncbi:3-ketosteroid-9-alpha-monooxygenase, ferredoxin reductase component [Actinoplanes philippinensis]|uniref:3-ketosteroid 9alpha-monooxygenase subunit B n=1 Tax=Actinoplanes philippinensis TaxID=35752 RepID=A0A1I2A2K7_9ACTN|nr:ferredoxin--NADP reductase [Actinoplanes philippinensis]GIE75133.1 3-ketosteroid-9-alpha-monooxygenase, ferredoxin reductase component [Actinoplanes philippinensis]SFE38026.1 3-ketosteroid 9alpha-monooxygenase subunit B [Actinoplanes philippinensis]